ncbi:MAG: hypothetical protein R3B47_07435 [Bacteroidia bacterium]
MIAIVLLERVFKIDYEAEKHQLRKDFPVDSELTEASVEITRPEVMEIRFATCLSATTGMWFLAEFS